jgi:hypothetical protein
MEHPRNPHDPSQLPDDGSGWKEVFPFALFGVTFVATIVTVILT